MKHFLRTILTAASSRAMPPLVIGFFFFVYIGIAFFTDETLITLMAFTRGSFFLTAILALIPLNSALRIILETGRQLKIRRALTGKTDASTEELFDETVTLPVSPIPAVSAFAKLEARLAAEGYKTCCTGNVLAAWRGITLFPARVLFLAGTLCLFTGILVSTTTRTSHRQMVVEGELLPAPAGFGGLVERIILANGSGLILKKTLDMEIAPSASGQGKRTFGIYPPSLYGGAFVYPRYLGLAILLHFSAPDLPTGFELHSFLNSYPPGKEDSVAITGSPYKIIFSLPEPDAGSDRYISYMTGSIIFQFKLLKGKDVLFSGSLPAGKEFVRDGYRLALPDVRRMVVTDFIGDYGVLFIWWSALFFGAAASFWLPLRAFLPRREMLFRDEAAATTACSRAEGRARSHAGVFHEALDLLAARKTDER